MHPLGRTPELSRSARFVTMSTPPSWPMPDPEPSNPFTAPAGGQAGGSPAAPGAGAAPSGDTGWAPAPYTSDRASDPSPYGPAPVPPPYGAPAVPQGQQYPQYAQGQPGQQYPPPAPGYGYPPAAPTYGYAQPPAPGYGYPPPVWGPAQPPMSGLAIASLATSIGGVFTLGAAGPVGLGLGIGALRRIRRTGARGRGLAIAGIAVGAVMTLGFAGYIALVAVGVSGGFDDTTYSTDTSGTAVTPPSTDVVDDMVEPYVLPTGLTPGLCYADAPYTYDLSDGVPVDCTQPHGAEIIGLVELTSAPTGMIDDAGPAVDEAWDACTAQMDVLATDASTSDLWMQLFYPYPDQWAAGETSGYCLISADQRQLVGSAVGHTLTTTPGTQS